jgi:hypothetical protein
VNAKQATKATKESRNRRSIAKSSQLAKERAGLLKARKRGRSDASKGPLATARDAIYDAIAGGSNNATAYLGAGVRGGVYTHGRYAYWEGAVERVVEILQREGYMVDGHVTIAHYMPFGAASLAHQAFRYIDPKVVIEWERG